jgi:beta-xylosidase
MIKRILIFSILLIIAHFTKAGDVAVTNCTGAIAGSSVRNSLKYNYDLYTGNNLVEPSDLSDDFNIPNLRSNWDYKLNEGEWNLKVHPGYLRIKAQKNATVQDINPEKTFSHKIKRNTIGEVVSMIDPSGMSNNTIAGIYCKSKIINYMGVKSINGSKQLIASVTNKEFYGPEMNETNVILRVTLGISKAWFEYSFNGIDFIKLGDEFKINELNNNDNFIGLYCLNDSDCNSSVDIDWFYYNPKLDVTTHYAETDKKIVIPEI